MQQNAVDFLLHCLEIYGTLYLFYIALWTDPNNCFIILFPSEKVMTWKKMLVGMTERKTQSHTYVYPPLSQSLTLSLSLSLLHSLTHSLTHSLSLSLFLCLNTQKAHPFSLSNTLTHA